MLVRGWVGKELLRGVAGAFYVEMKWLYRHRGD